MGTPPSPGLPIALAVLATILAILLARRRAEHGPIAIFLATMTALDVGRLLLRGIFDLGTPGPYEGARRVAFHVDELGFLAWPAGLVALALALFAGVRRPWHPAAVWGVVVGALVALYPSELVRANGLQHVYLAAHLCALAVVVVTFARWAPRRPMPGSEHAAMLIICILDVARLLAFRGSIFDNWASFALPTNAVAYGLLVAVEVVFLWIVPSPRS